MKGLVVVLAALLLATGCTSDEDREHDFIDAIEAGDEYGDYAISTSRNQSMFISAASTYCDMQEDGDNLAASQEAGRFLTVMGYRENGYVNVFGFAAQDHLC